jgi:uncharacterized membrane protein
MENVSKKAKILSAISYIPFPPLFLISLFSAKGDRFVDHHAKQGLVFFVVWFLLWLVSLFKYVSFLADLGFLALIVLAIVAIVGVCRGKAWTAPLIGKYADRIQF